VPKPKGVRRILILGDSFTEGDYDEDTIALHLEARLKQTGGGSQVEVVNCGCASYSPLLEYLRLKNQLLEMEPDEIILNIDQTDIFDDYWRYRPFLRVGPDNEPLGVGQPFTLKRRVVKWLELHSDLGRFLSGLRWRWMTRSDGPGTQASTVKPRAPTQANIFVYQSTLPVDSSSWQLEVGYCLGNIARIIRYTQQRGIPLTITMYPHRQQLRPDPGEKLWNREFESRVERLCRESGVGFFSAFDGIASAYRTNPDIYWATDMHFTPEGARIWADLVTDYYLTHQPGTR
jgi:lysophospholipase L1-like esterase